VTPELVASLVRADAGGAPAVVATAHGTMQPLLGRYEPVAVRLLAGAAAEGVPARAAVAAISPRLFEVADPDALFNVNAPEDLLQAAAILDRRRRGTTTRT
jgi:molybdopterin-guanine dinucleotide biosynthesis protein A